MNALQVHPYQNATIPSKSILNDEGNVIKLIRMFRGHECLWNPNCENYRNLSYKESIWEAIASQFGRQVTADQVKRKVKGLRNCFSTERSRVQKSLLDGRGEIYVPTLYYYKEFDFLQGIKGISKGCGNIKVDYSEDYNGNISPCDESMYNTNYTDNNNEYAATGNTPNQNEDVKIFEPIALNRQAFDSPAQKKKRTASYSANGMDIKYVHMPQTQSKNATQVQSLCEMIRVDLQDVSEELFYDAKWKIMDILREVHKKHLEEQKIRSNSISGTKIHTATSSGPPLELADTSSAAVVENHQYPQP